MHVGSSLRTRPHPSRPHNHRYLRHPCTTGWTLQYFQSGEMNTEMPFQDGRKLFHHRMSALASELRWIRWWSLLKNLHSEWFQSRPLNGDSTQRPGTPFRGLEFQSETSIGTILNADFRSTLADMAPFSNLLRSPTTSSIVE